jgi:hypothetical protein
VYWPSGQVVSYAAGSKTAGYGKAIAASKDDRIT